MNVGESLSRYTEMEVEKLKPRDEVPTIIMFRIPRPEPSESVRLSFAEENVEPFTRISIDLIGCAEDQEISRLPAPLRVILDVPLTINALTIKSFSW